MTNEPVAIPGAIMSVIVSGLGLAVLLGLPLTTEQVGGIVTFAGACIALITVLQRHYSTPNAKVVEHEIHGDVYAGEASELPTGTYVREAGTLHDAGTHLPESGSLGE